VFPVVHEGDPAESTDLHDLQVEAELEQLGQTQGLILWNKPSFMLSKDQPKNAFIAPPPILKGFYGFIQAVLIDRATACSCFN
jgi:hypothetical protein